MKRHFCIQLTAVCLLLSVCVPFFARAEIGGSANAGALSRSTVHARKIVAAASNLGTTVGASAAVGVPNADIGLRASATAKAGKDLADALSGVLEDVLDALQTSIFEALKKKILDMMVDQIIVYIQGGGEPRFITDWQGFFTEVAQGAAGDFAKELGLGFLCSPFSLQLRLSMIPQERFAARFDCTLDKIVRNIQNFYDDFRNGGWIAFDSALQMNNNFYGALLLAIDQRDRRVADALDAAKEEVNSGGGFLSAKQCWDDIGQKVSPNFPGAHCEIVTPGRVIGEAAGKAVGSDIDWLLSSNDLAHYIAAISNAVFNRLIKEGVGLLGVSTPAAPQRVRGGEYGAIYSNTPPPSIASSARAYSALGGSVSAQLQPLGSPLQSLVDAQTERLKLEISLQTLLQSLLDCRTSRVDIVSKIGADATQRELDTQKNLITRLQDELSSNRSALQEFNATIAAMDQSGGMPTPAQNEVLNRSVAANAALVDAQTDLERAKSVLTDRKAEIERQLQECRGNRP